MGLSKNNLIQDESSEKLFFTKLTALVYPFFMFKVIRKKDQDMFETHVDSLVRADHPYRKLLNALDLKKLVQPLQALYSII